MVRRLVAVRGGARSWRLAGVGGYWAGHFEVADKDTLYMATGRTSGGCIYRIEGGNIVTQPHCNAQAGAGGSLPAGVISGSGDKFLIYAPITRLDD